jgi:hypothetical protein
VILGKNDSQLRRDVKQRKDTGCWKTVWKWEERKFVRFFRSQIYRALCLKCLKPTSLLEIFKGRECVALSPFYSNSSENIEVEQESGADGPGYGGLDVLVAASSLRI